MSTLVRDGLTIGHHGRVTNPWPMPYARDLDSLAALSTAPLWSASDFPPVPSVSADPAPGVYELIDDTGVYVREIPSSAPIDAPATLYVHGLAGSSTNFDALGTLLSGRTRGFAVDLPGFGRSDPPPREQYSIGRLSALLAEVIDRIGAGSAGVNLVANSLGGMVALDLAVRGPERVRTLTLISPAVPDLRMTSDRGADPRLGLLLAPGTLAPAVRRLSGISAADRALGMAQLCYGDPSVLTDHDLRVAAEDTRWRLALPWVHTATVRALRGLMRSYLRAGRRTFRAAAAGVGVPTLVVWGTRDRLVDPRLAAPTAAAFPNGRLVVLPGVGHVSQMEDPLSTARAVAALWAGVPCAGPVPTMATSNA